jgi:hypothetical protein
MRLTAKSWLEANYELARIEGLAMMTYNPSIGRVLAPGGVQQFKRIVARRLRGLRRIHDRQSFDRWHHRFVRRTSRIIKRTSGGRRITYGQAQKAPNVFLKIYVDWAKLPDPETAQRIVNFLHVPLDSIVMGRVRNEHREQFEQIVAPVYRREGEWPSDLRLSLINRPMYAAWQRFFRRVLPKRTILLDVIWSRAPRD